MNKKIRFIIIGFIVLMIPIVIFGKREVAIQYQKQAMDLCPPWDDSPDFETAMKKIDFAIKLAPRNYLFHVTKAQFLERQEKYKEANMVMRSIFDFKKDYAEGYVAIALNYERLGFKDSAYMEYTNALRAYNLRIEKYQNDSARLFSERLSKAFVLRQSGKVTQSKKEFEELRLSYPEKVEIIKSIENLNTDITEIDK
jgi:tetratricopeptide (TPR) repeat protein